MSPFATRQNSRSGRSDWAIGELRMSARYSEASGKDRDSISPRSQPMWAYKAFR